MKKIKDFFATPKRAIVTSVCLVGGLGALTAGSVAVTALSQKIIPSETLQRKILHLRMPVLIIHRQEYTARSLILTMVNICMMWNFHPTGWSMIIGSRRLTVRFFGGTASRWTVMRQT